MRKTVFCVIVAANLFFMGGCAVKAPENLLAEEVQTETVYLRSDGTVQSAYVEEFTESYYEEAELRTFMQEMIDSYNGSAGTKAVDLAQLLVADGRAYAILTYDSVKAYAEFNTDTEEEAEKLPAEILSEEQMIERYGDVVFSRAKKEPAAKTGGEFLNGKKQRFAVVNGPIQVKTPANILYYTEGGRLIDERTFEVPADTEAVIVYKK